ncbi:hypothetical protein SNE40_016637 [Patella caerulea]|uniref:Uncharacterized protein n=1 Tax=Patella caerulea TaxID=87958 RepID=A0AAN8JDG3_PATCE
MNIKGFNQVFVILMLFVFASIGGWWYANNNTNERDDFMISYARKLLTDSGLIKSLVNDVKRTQTAPYSGINENTRNMDIKKVLPSKDTKIVDTKSTSGKSGLIMFTTWTDNEEKSLVHANVMNSWQFWKPLVKPLFFYSNKTTGDRMKKSGWLTLPVSNTACGTSKIPVIRDMFLDAMKNYDSPLYGYANGDISFDNGMSTAINFLKESDIVREKPVMILVRRTNVDFSNGPLLNKSSNFTEILKRGQPLTDGSSDGFFTNKLFPWKYIPDVVVGRIGIGMWIVSYARAVNATIIDITKTVRAIHMTTKSGNYESHWKPNSKCNHELYAKYQAKPSNWGCGHINCAGLEVGVTKEGKVLMRGKPKRRFPKNCFKCTMDLSKLLPASYGKSAMSKFTV